MLALAGLEEHPSYMYVASTGIVHVPVAAAETTGGESRVESNL